MACSRGTGVLLDRISSSRHAFLPPTTWQTQTDAKLGQTTPLRSVMPMERILRGADCRKGANLILSGFIGRPTVPPPYTIVSVQHKDTDVDGTVSSYMSTVHVTNESRCAQFEVNGMRCDLTTSYRSPKGYAKGDHEPIPLGRILISCIECGTTHKRETSKRCHACTCLSPSALDEVSCTRARCLRKIRSILASERIIL